jgi:acyl-CoA synthetase (AMP-forming)/AMP-acid ligase II
MKSVGMQDGLTWQPFQEGEIVTKGPHVTRGYWRDPDATRAAFTSRGWLRTGDIGFFDDHGHLWLHGRLKNVIRSGGENVNAAEVEAVLRSLPQVLDAAVVGVPHQRLGEAVAALLQTEEGTVCCSNEERSSAKGAQLVGGSRADAERLLGNKLLRHAPSLLSWGGAEAQQARLLLGPAGLSRLQEACRRKGLSAFKVPRLVAVSSLPLPRTAMGKARKQEVIALIKSLQQHSRL